MTSRLLHWKILLKITSTSPNIQKYIVSATAIETINVIINETGDSLFSILVDESRDISMKEQMTIVVIERFTGIERVSSTRAISLKDSIDDLFSRHGLSISRLQVQCYDGASNMRSEFKSLKTLILKENPCAFYVRCCAHQLQLELVVVAKKQVQFASRFSLVASEVTVAGTSSKRCDILQEKQTIVVAKTLNDNVIVTSRGSNQVITLKRYGHTQRRSHYGTLINLIKLFQHVVDVLSVIVDDGSNYEQRCEENNLLELIQSVQFVFSPHLMRTILGITDELSKTLQRKDQDIVNAMGLVKLCKEQLIFMQENGWVSLFNKVQELNHRFTKLNTDFLICLACLCPDDAFPAFDKEKLICFAKFYPYDFFALELMVLDDKFETYIIDMRSNQKFLELKGISSLAQKMAESKEDKVYPLVYTLVTLVLVLLVATATIERVFSAMNILNNRLRNIYVING